MMTLFSKKVLISNKCISGLMSNLIKKSWTDSNLTFPYTILKTSLFLTLKWSFIGQPYFNSYSRKQPTLTAEKTLRIYVRKDGNLPVLLDCLLRFAWILNLIGWSGIVLHCLTKLHVSKYLSETWPVQNENTSIQYLK